MRIWGFEADAKSEIWKLFNIKRWLLHHINNWRYQMPEEARYIVNPGGSFMNEDQIFSDLIQNRLEGEIINLLKHNFDPPLNEQDAKMVKETGFNPNLFARSQFGMWIRNSYGLWSPDNPYTNEDPRHDQFADQIAGRIIDRLVRYYAEK
jgi:hypothetical protein